MNAQKFGHSVGQFFKKIDRTLSFLPEKPRKVTVAVAALAASPVLAGVIISQAKISPNIGEVGEQLDVLANSQKTSMSPLPNTVPDIVSPFDDEYDGYREGPEGFGCYMFGKRIS